MRRFGRAIESLGLLAGALSLGTSAAQAHDVRAGVMTCDVDSGFGFVVGSSRDLHCTFLPTTGNPEHYAGSISKFGVDIGYVQNAVIVWDVVAPTVALAPGSLTGATEARPQASCSGSGSAPMCWLAAPKIRSRCSQSALRAAPVSISPAVSHRLI